MVNTYSNDKKQNKKSFFDEIKEKVIIYKDKKIEHKNRQNNKKKFKYIEAISNLYDMVSKFEYIAAVEAYKDNNSSKMLSSFEKKVYGKLFNNINNCEKILNHQKYSALSGNTIISIKNVTKFYSSKFITNKVLDDVSIDIEAGDFVVILGPSGSGKTSLMNLMAGIDRPTYGSVNVCGFVLENLTNNELTNFRKDVIGYIFQRYGLLPNLTAEENIMFGYYLGKNTFSSKELEFKSKNNMLDSNLLNMNEKELINYLMEIISITHIKDKYPYEMSGGQKQRVAIARTIAKKPAIIFGDEPTSAIDDQTSDVILEMFKKINNTMKTTIILVTHNEYVAKYANKIIYVLDGKINNVVVKEKGEIFDENKKDKKEIKNFN